jgi:hypothetical protein
MSNRQSRTFESKYWIYLLVFPQKVENMFQVPQRPMKRMDARKYLVEKYISIFQVIYVNKLVSQKDLLFSNIWLLKKFGCC